MRLIRLLVALACIAVGIAISILNTTPIQLDIGVVQWSTTLGVVVIAAILAGVLLGGLALSASVILPMRRRMTRLQRANAGDIGGEGRS